MEIEKILGVEQIVYHSEDGEQKIYVLPDDFNIEQILGNVPGLRTGEITQSQMWRKTDVMLDHKEQSKTLGEITTCVQAMDKRIERLEYLLNQVVGHDRKGNDEGSK